MSCSFHTEKNVQFEELAKVIEEKKNLRNPLIEILRIGQEIFGYLPIEVQQFIADKLNIPVSHVYGVVTFYNFFSMKPRGKHMVNVCMGTACFVKGAPKLMQMLSEELHCQPGETSPDGMFTLNAVRCVGACSLAPVFVIDEDSYGKIDTREKVKASFVSYRKG